MVEFEHKDLFLQSSIEKQMKIVSDDGVVIDNSCLHLESFSLNENLCSESTLKFGCCEASSIEFRTSNVYTPLKDKWLTVSETLNGSDDIVFQFGKYKVFSDTPDSDKSYRDVVAYDCMYDILNANVGSWYNTLTFPMTLKAFRNSFFNHLGIQQVETTLINDDITLNKTVSVGENEVLSGKDIITSICEINGVFGHINRLGKFVYIQLKENQYALFSANDLYPNNNLYPKDWDKTLNRVGSKYQSCNYEDCLYDKITKLTLIINDSTINISSGSDGKEYFISNNILISDKSESELQTIADRLLNVIKVVEYRPYSCNAIFGNPTVEVGDAIRINAPKQNIMSYVLNRTLKGIQALSDSFSASGNNDKVESVNSIQSTFNSIQGKFHKVDDTLETFSSEIYDPVTGTSRITQNADSISSEVKDRQNGDNANYSLIKQNADAISSEIVARGESEEALSSRIGQTASSIELNVSNGDDSSSISLTITKEDGSTISTKAKTIRFEGDVVFASDLTDGTTVISGDNIKTGKVSADCIKTDELIVGTNVTMGANAKISWDNVTDRDDIVDKDYVEGEIGNATDGMLTSDNYRTTITNDTIKTWNLEVGNEIKMGKNAKISWLTNDSGYQTEDSIKNTVITKDYIETLKIKAGSVSAESIDTENVKIQTGQIEKLVVGTNVTMGENATISWTKVTEKSGVANKSDIPTDVSQLTDNNNQKWSTTIGENWIKSANIEAQNLKVHNGNFTDTFNVQIPYGSNYYKIGCANGTMSMGVVGGSDEQDPYSIFARFQNAEYTIASYGDIIVDVVPKRRDGTPASFRCKNYNDDLRTPISSNASDGARISSIGTTSKVMAVYSQWGSSGASFSSKNFEPSSSDIRLKDNILDCEIDNALEIINQIKLRSFDWKDGINGHQKIGFVADELEEIDDRLSIGGGVDEDGYINYKSVSSFYLQGYEVKAIQELSAENKALKQELNELKQLLKEKGVI